MPAQPRQPATERVARASVTKCGAAEHSHAVPRPRQTHLARTYSAGKLPMRRGAASALGAGQVMLALGAGNDGVSPTPSGRDGVALTRPPASGAASRRNGSRYRRFQPQRGPTRWLGKLP